jgi:hypothetical protein
MQEMQMLDAGANQGLHNLFTTSQRIKALNAPPEVFLKAIDKCKFDETPHTPNGRLILNLLALLQSGDTTIEKP